MSTQLKLRRPALRYHGGKWLLAKWIISHFPPHSIYTEAFCGAASVLLQKPRSAAEVINDLSGDVVNLFRVLRDPVNSEKLIRQIALTPFAYDEYRATRTVSDDPVERARQMIVASYMSIGTDATTRKGSSGFRSYSNVMAIGATPAQSWVNLPDNIAVIAQRMMGVVIDNRDANLVLRRHDTSATLHYVDPPYPHSTRGNSRGHYQFEMSDAEHQMLARTLHNLKGMVVLSGYPCELYDDELYADWQRLTRQTLADSARPRTEVLWLNPAAVKANSTLS